MTLIESFTGLQPIFQLYVLFSFSVTALVFYLGYKWDTPFQITLIHGFVSFWTGLATLNYSTGFLNPDYTIYLDWVVTTPLLVLSLGLTAGDGRLENLSDTAFGVLAQILVVVTGFLAFTTGQVQYFLIGCFLFIAVIYFMVFEVGRESSAQYRITAAGFFFLWIGYPVLFYFGVLNSMLPQGTVEIGLVILPVISKHFYGLYDMVLTKQG